MENYFYLNLKQKTVKKKRRKKKRRKTMNLSVEICPYFQIIIFLSCGALTETLRPR